MNHIDIEKLALETLYGDHIGPRNSCFRTNDAGLRLAECGFTALADIENVIEKKVAPLFNDATTTADANRLIGLKYLIGAYLVIGVRANDGRVFEFINKQPKAIQVESINCSSTFFLRTGNSYNFGVPPNSYLLNYLKRQTQSTDPECARLAQDIYQELTANLR